LRSKYFLYIALVALLAIIITGPALASDNPRIEYTADYDAKGRIDFERVIGHECYTGAEKTQTIKGYGDFTKSDEVKIYRHVVTHKDKTDWSVPEDAIGGLTVTTVIDLCARPMSTADHDYIENDELIYEGIDEATADFVYERYGLREGDIINPYHPLVVDGTIEVSPKTEQVWANQIRTVPGHEGTYHADFIAAYGPGPYAPHYDEEFLWELDKSKEGYELWWHDDTKEFGVDYGDRYVGNYFDIEQYAYTSSGEMRRFISVSEPFEKRFLEEAFLVTGTAEVEEAFSMDVLPPGPDAVPLEWYELF